MANNARMIVIDLGGTNVRFGIIDDRLTVLFKVKQFTRRHEGPRAVLQQLLDLIRLNTYPEIQIAGLVVGVPGPFDPGSGTFYEVPNLPGWKGFPLLDGLRAEAEFPVWMQNDANLAALAEGTSGAGKGHDKVAYFTVSTGVGGGVIDCGRISLGAHGLAGEFGHMRLGLQGPTCNLGHPGCLEGIASGTGIVNRARGMVQHQAASELLDQLFHNGHEVSAESIARAARSGDKSSLQLFHDAGEALGIAAINVVSVIDPSVIVFGGGVMQSWDLLSGPLLRIGGVGSLAFPQVAIPLVRGSLGDDAGLIGGAIFGWQQVLDVQDTGGRQCKA